MTEERRTSKEISKVFAAKGCEVAVEELGTSYRAGGEIFIFSPGLNFKSAGLDDLSGAFEALGL